MSLVAQCPGCGAEVTFAHGAPIRVCDYCRSVVARKDRDVESLGKVADLVQTRSPLELDLAGAWRGARFTLVGRAQLEHPKGGVWDEWYAAFDDGRWGWLAEAEGRFFLTFELDDAQVRARVPGLARVQPGRPVAGLPGESFVCREISAGSYRSAKGEIPFRFTPGERFRYADLEGRGGAFATLDYGQRGDDEPPVALYVGREVQLAELGWADRAPAERDPATIKAERIACPECDGNLELAAPDRTQRVGCPYCGTLLDAEHGKLKKLALVHGPRHKPTLPIGTKGTLRGQEWQVIGHLRRAVVDEGIEYPWEEHLLYRPQDGFRWLVCAEGHWSFVEPIPAGQVDDRHQVAVARGTSFKLFQLGTATVRQVLGELYWKVEVGEQVSTRDYVAPPLMLSYEGDADEVNWSIGTWMPPFEVERAFGVKVDLAPSAIAPHQPYPHGAVLRTWGIALGVAFVGLLLVFMMAGTRKVLDVVVPVDPVAADPATGLEAQTLPGGEKAVVWFSEPFDLKRRKNVEIRLEAPVDNGWVYVEGDLVDEATGLVQSFTKSVEYYHGVSGGESWTEGARLEEVYLSALPTGSYVLRLAFQTSATQPLRVSVVVRQGVPRLKHWLLLLLGLSIIPGLVLWHRATFEARRREASNV